MIDRLPIMMLLAALVAPALAAAAPLPFPTSTRTDVGTGLSDEFEPSGAAWNPVTHQLFLCGDNGAVARVNADGSGATNWELDGDLEGVAIADTASNFIYVIDEGSARITEFNFVTGAATRVFDVAAASPATGVAPLNSADREALDGDDDNAGPEALAFVPDAQDPQGGLFYVGSQQNGTIYKFRLSLTAGTTALYMGKLKTWPAGDNDLSGLEYDWENGVLIAVWDSQNVIRVLTPTGTILKEWNVPANSNDEEGLGYTGTALFIAEDPAPASEVWRYDGFTTGIGKGAWSLY